MHKVKYLTEGLFFDKLEQIGLLKRKGWYRK